MGKPTLIRVVRGKVTEPRLEDEKDVTIRYIGGKQAKEKRT